MITETLTDKIKDFILEGVQEEQVASREGPPLWKALREAGTELWLDTGDIESAADLWTPEMSALTTNNTLLNREIQKGIYDDYITEAAKILEELDTKEKIMEIAFILNARHGLRLVGKFGGKVSVELHTDLAYDLNGILFYGRRFYEISPDHFIVKVPLTATGFIGARELRKMGVPVNFTLGFSARHNYIAASFAEPNFGNVFLGRINSYLADNGLGTGENAGEKVTLASQRTLAGLRESKGTITRQIAASMRSGSQVKTLSGVDVFTMPLKVARQAVEDLIARDIKNRIDSELTVDLARGIDPEEVKFRKLFEVNPEVETFTASIVEDPPLTGEELASRGRELGCSDLFPQLSDAELEQIAADGKIPVHSRWRSRILKNQLAVDTLLNLAGLATFAEDQKALDDRIGKLIG
jgi:transaldolase